MNVKKYWRIYVLIIVTIISLTIIFSPAIPVLDINQDEMQVSENQSWDQKYMNLQYSIELAGGTRIRAPIVGATAENAIVNDNEIEDLEQKIADDFEDTSFRDVTISEMDEDDDDNNKYIEITSSNADEDVLRDSLNNHNIEYDFVRSGVTPNTQENMVDIIQDRLDEAGLTGSNVRIVTLSDDTNVILAEVPDASRERTISLIQERGDVSVQIYHSETDDGSYTQEVVLTQDDFRTIGTANAESERQPPHVPVVINSDVAEQFQDRAVETGLARSGGSMCQYEQNPESTQPCLLTVVDGEVVDSSGMASNLANSMVQGTWASDPSFIIQTSTYEEAQDLSINLRSGSLPAELDISSGEVTFVSAQQGEQFRYIAVLIGLLSTLVVATSISLRYGKIKIAAPMMITASAEVIILLAIASLMNYPIDIAVIAGFVAVIGTGVDDLIIIADQVMGGENPAESKLIFDKRFKKALWIILGAAGTTILALGPLAILELNELQGFAIFTILGVIAGVLLTRPAYGDMLRILFTEK